MTGNQDASKCIQHIPNTFPPSGIKNDGSNGVSARSLPGSEGSVDLAKTLSAFYRPSTEITRCIRGTPGIIVLRFCSDIKKIITTTVFPKGSADCDPLKSILACQSTLLFRCVTYLFSVILIYEI